MKFINTENINLVSPTKAPHENKNLPQDIHSTHTSPSPTRHIKAPKKQYAHAQPIRTVFLLRNETPPFHIFPISFCHPRLLLNPLSNHIHIKQSTNSKISLTGMHKFVSLVALACHFVFHHSPKKRDAMSSLVAALMHQRAPYGIMSSQLSRSPPKKKRP